MSLNLLRLYIILSITILNFCDSYSQQSGWHLLDFENDSVYGISLDKAYVKLLNDKKVKDTVIVAIIDNGVDIFHDDLKDFIWENNLERGSDEDLNGLKNDKNGWNYLGNQFEQNILDFKKEEERLYVKLRMKYPKNIKSITDTNSSNSEVLLLNELTRKFKNDSLTRTNLRKEYLYKLLKFDSITKAILDLKVYKFSDINKALLSMPTNVEVYALHRMKSLLYGDKSLTNVDFINSIIKYCHSNPIVIAQGNDSIREKVIGDKYFDFNDKYYGNNNLCPDNFCSHGTHVAGIISANRYNDEGITGICNTVKIMPIRAIPLNGDEYDKDVALAIYYAVNNGAKIINMSFTKRYSPEEYWVQDAIKYALNHDVLIVKAAGNEGANLDSIPFFPSSLDNKTKQEFGNVITVGASGPYQNNIVASFSNYGKSVNLFAPGVDILSTTSNNTYSSMSGTSMAAPMVTGVAAIIRSYYPNLTANQVKFIIEKSSKKIEFKFDFLSCKERKITMNEICNSGGILNAYQAIRLAEELSF